MTWAWNPQVGTSDTAHVELLLPPDLLSFAVVVDDPGQHTGLAWLAVDGVPWIDVSREDELPPAWYSPPFFHWAAEGGGFVAPMDVSHDPAGAGSIAFAAAALDDQTGGQATVHVLLRTGPPDAPVELDLNLVLVGEPELYVEDVDELLVTASRVLSTRGGPRVGEVRYFTLDGDDIVAYDDAAVLQATPVDGGPQRGVAVFFITDFVEADGTLGVAGGIPGPLAVDGADRSGVVLALDPHRFVDGTLDTTQLGGTLAHELGHQLGLFHTTEADGSRTEALDTPDCPDDADVDGDGLWSAAECAAYDGTNFMFWAAGPFPQEEVSVDQAFVLGRSPVAREVGP